MALTAEIGHCLDEGCAMIGSPIDARARDGKAVH